MEKIPLPQPVSVEISKLYNEDQSGRQNWDDPIVREETLKQDVARTVRARELYKNLNTGEILLETDDLVRLAFILQHGTEADDYKRAHELGIKAGKAGEWIAAAAEDRYLLAIGQRQKWGTQFTLDGEGKHVQCEMMSDEESGITDDMRKERGIPSRDEQLKDYLEAM